MSDHDQFLKALLESEADLRAFLGALIRDRQDCQDVFQETALTLWRKFDEYDPRRPFAAWARGIAANKALQHRAKSGRTPVAFSPETVSAIIDAIERRERRQPPWTTALDALKKCTQLLPENLRKLLAMRYGEQRSVIKIAAQLGSTPAAVSMSLSRIRARLRECVERRLARAEEKTE